LQSEANIESGHGAVEIDEIAGAGTLNLTDALRFTDCRRDEAQKQAERL